MCKRLVNLKKKKMKKITKEYSKKLIVTLAIAASILGFTPLKSIANDTTTNTENLNSVQFAGIENNELVFNVKIKNTIGEKFTLVVYNEAGEIVFLKGYNDKSFEKQVKLLKSENSTVYHFSIWKTSENKQNKTLVEVIDSANF